MRGALPSIAGFLALTGALACDNVSIITVVDARVFRVEERRLAIDVDLRAAEQSGNTVGPYCVSAHALPLGFDTATPGLTAYRGQADFVQVCGDDLYDGDTRTLHLVLPRTDTAEKVPIRVQVRRGRLVDDWRSLEAP